MSRDNADFRPSSLLTLFLAERRYDGVREVSIENYRYAITRFLTEGQPPDDVRDISPAHLYAWTEAMRARGLKPGAINTYQGHVWTWLRWLYRHRAIPEDLTARVRLVRVRDEEKKRRTATEDTKKALVRFAAQASEHRARNIAIIEMLWSTGIRRSELASIQLADVNFDDGSVRVLRTKMGRPRLVGLGREAVLALHRYIQAERGSAPGSLFLQRMGKPMSSNAIRCMLRSLALSAGVEATSHDFRRACAARLLRAGMEVDNVARQLGHSSLAQSLIYGEEGRDERAVARFHELDSIRPLRRSG